MGGASLDAEQRPEVLPRDLDDVALVAQGEVVGVPGHAVATPHEGDPQLLDDVRDRQVERFPRDVDRRAARYVDRRRMFAHAFEAPREDEIRLQLAGAERVVCDPTSWVDDQYTRRTGD